MASIYQLKSRFQSLLRPLTNGLAGAGITANQVTLTAAFLSLAVGAFITYGFLHPSVFPGGYLFLLVVPLFLFIRMALNAIDGMLAREHGMQSRLGGYYNELGDVVSDVFLYAPFAVYRLQYGQPTLEAVAATALFVIASVATEVMGILAQTTGSRRYDGPMGKSDRAFWVSLLCIYLALGGPTWPVV
ncbi:MAG: CDP-alcohol phosphatidyltransferase family protein, partial [Leptospiraceae bacterium]|nr:CDP-alcohol phosphatidyltransferase family protein [Leptospiraceae bacterium]